jgi:hypothetical protein
MEDIAAKLVELGALTLSPPHSPQLLNHGDEVVL